MEHQRRRLECPFMLWAPGFTPFQYEISFIIIIVVCFIVIIISNNFVVVIIVIIIIIIIIVSSSSSAGSQAAGLPKNKYLQILILILLSLYNMLFSLSYFLLFL